MIRPDKIERSGATEARWTGATFDAGDVGDPDLLYLHDREGRRGLPCHPLEPRE
jgi:hypothetical protein